MARNFGSGSTNSDRVENDSCIAPGSTGTQSLWIKPTWSSGDSVAHLFEAYANATFNGNPTLSFQKFSDNNLYAGWDTIGGADSRVTIADTGIFSAGIWANHILTWDAGVPLTTYYVNNVSKGTSASALTTTGISQHALGNVTAVWSAASANTWEPASSALAWACTWNVVLNSAERAAITAGAWPISIRPEAIISFAPLDGIDSPELDLSGNWKLLTLFNANGTATYADDPPFCARPTPEWFDRAINIAAAGFQPAWAVPVNVVHDGFAT